MTPLPFSIADLERFVFLYQMGKVGSVSITRALQSLGYEVLHCHFLSPQVLDYYARCHWFGSIEVKKSCDNYIAFREGLAQGHFVATALKAITLTRDPLARAVSYYIYWAGDRYRPFIEARYGAFTPQTVATHLEYLAEAAHAFLDIPYPHTLDDRFDLDVVAFAADLLHPLRWFDQEVRAFLGVDILAVPFTGGAQVVGNVLVLRQEDFAACAERAIADHLGLEGLRIDKLNAAESHASKEILEAIRKVRFPAWLVEYFARSRYMTHFYADELDRFRERWTRTRSYGLPVAHPAGDRAERSAPNGACEPLVTTGPDFLLCDMPRVDGKLIARLINAQPGLALSEDVLFLPELIQTGIAYQNAFEKDCFHEAHLSLRSRWRDGARKLLATLGLFSSECCFGLRVVGRKAALAADDVITLFPKAKLVVMTRDPREDYRAYLETGQGYGAHHLAYANLFVRAAEGLGKETFLLRQEDLLGEPGPILEALRAFLCAPPKTALPDTVATTLREIRVDRWRSELSAETLFLLNHLAPMLTLYGYPAWEGASVSFRTKGAAAGLAGRLHGMTDAATGKDTFEDGLPGHITLCSAGAVGIELDGDWPSDFEVALDGFGTFVESSFLSRRIRILPLLEGGRERPGRMPTIFDIMTMQEKPRVYLYTAGGQARQFLRTFRLDRLDLRGAIDSYATGTLLEGGRETPIVSLGEALSKGFDLILIPSNHYSDIRSHLEGAGLVAGRHFLEVMPQLYGVFPLLDDEKPRRPGLMPGWF
jgi:hypothetical protein